MNSNLVIIRRNLANQSWFEISVTARKPRAAQSCPWTLHHSTHVTAQYSVSATGWGFIGRNWTVRCMYIQLPTSYTMLQCCTLCSKQLPCTMHVMYHTPNEQNKKHIGAVVIRNIVEELFLLLYSDCVNNSSRGNLDAPAGSSWCFRKLSILAFSWQEPPLKGFAAVLQHDNVSSACVSVCSAEIPSFLNRT